MAKITLEKSESLNFYKYLCQKIGSEEVVRVRGLAYVISDIGHRSKLITSGSKGEGLDLKGSDLDEMVIDPGFKVNPSEPEFLAGRMVPLVMNTEETRPGFTQLNYLIQYGNHVTIHAKVCKTLFNFLQKNYLGYYVLSSEQYQLRKLLSPCIPATMDPKIHGPCISDKNETHDIAWCLKSDKWISQANQWIKRPRKTWPSTELISQIISCGVLFVPIDSKGSINEHLEWRISFSVAEKILIFSLSHTQLLCYGMLKILLKEVVEKHEDLKGLLCSYFLKTLVFWISEETEIYLWRPDTIIPCFMACLQRLMYCVKYSILSHYFIPDNNFFDLRFNITNKEKLIILFNNLNEQGITCFAASDTLQDYLSYSHKITESMISRNVRLLLQLMPTLNTKKHQGKVDNFSRLLFEFLHTCNSRTSLSKGLFVSQLSGAFMIASESTKYKISLGHKSQYINYKHDLSYLMIGLHSDAVSGLLMLASFFYVHNNYFASLTVITYALQKYTDEKIYTGTLSIDSTFNNVQRKWLNLLKKEKLHTILKSVLFHPITFDLNSSMVPPELQLDFSILPTMFHSLPYAHFLCFLCYYRLHDFTSCTQSFQQLRNVQRILTKCGTKIIYPISLNTIIMLGIGYQLMGERHLAERAFQEAADCDIYNATSAASRLSSLI